MFFKFITLSIIVLFFYFNTQYWCGKSIKELSSSRLWQGIYVILSSLGYGLYRFSEWISHKIICFIINKVHFLDRNVVHPVLSKTINIIVYSIFIIGMVQIYDIINKLIIIVGLGDIKIFNDSLIKIITGDKLSFGDILLNCSAYINVIYYIATQKEFMSGIIVIALLFMFNIIYYSSFYGFLKQKVCEFSIFDILNIQNEEISATVDEIHINGNSFILNLKENLKSFLTKRTWLKSLKDVRVLINVLIILFCVTWLSIKLEKNIYSGMDLVLKIADELGIVKLLLNFVITSMFSLITIVTGRSTYRICPPYIQNNIDNFTDRIDEYSNDMEERREEWAEYNDISTSNGRSYQYNTTYRQRQNDDSRMHRENYRENTDSNRYEDNRNYCDDMNLFNQRNDGIKTYHEAAVFIRNFLRRTNNEDINLDDFCRFILNECSYIPNAIKNEVSSENIVVAAAYCLEVFGDIRSDYNFDNIINGIFIEYRQSRHNI